MKHGVQTYAKAAQSDVVWDLGLRTRPVLDNGQTDSEIAPLIFNS